MKRYLYILGALLLLPLSLRAQEDTIPAPEPASRASLLPDISVVGNLKGMLTNREDAELDRHFELEEIELVLQSGIYPGVRGDLILAVHGPEFSPEVEEGFLTVDQFTPRLPVGGRAGIVRLPFGKVNPIHPHHLPYADTPAVVRNLLGEEFIGNGFEVTGLIPARGDVFVQAQLGRWNPRAHHRHDDEDADPHAHQFDFTDTFTLGRLWTGIPLGGNSELEVGASRAVGTHLHEHADGTLHEVDLRLQGYDVTWRRWLPGGRRILLQGEHIASTTVGSTKRVSDGYYLTGAYRLNPYYEVGARYDHSEAAWPIKQDHPDPESSLAAFVTRNLNETTYARLQVKRGKDLEGERYNEVTLQVVFGFGPHAHPLQ